MTGRTEERVMWHELIGVEVRAAERRAEAERERLLAQARAFRKARRAERAAGTPPDREGSAERRGRAARPAAAGSRWRRAPRWGAGA
ncbi:hypothetical protein [Streptomyces marincola]|uniref:hypothetical protein n=1 Tax=Streptomyces marincola TaxID=2878388 RepID=UPI001CF15054|nr:hypothetical protein [Streptomyces marincola]UCM90654.1 hypothetical protein LC193_23435 [Streptomyces marincola]